MRPRLEACYFRGSDPFTQWDRLAERLRASAQKWCPGWTVNIVRMNMARLHSLAGSPNHQANTVKLTHWERLIRESSDGELVLLIDADTLILRPLDDVWDEVFDVAYTTRPFRIPFNGGVVFVRVSDRARTFMARWLSENMALMHSRQPMTWRREYGGVNQAALARVLKAGLDVILRELPCVQWNCEDTSWKEFDRNRTRIVHIKGALRHACFDSRMETNDVKRICQLWRSADQSAG